MFRSAFRLKDEDILVLGQARNDCLESEFIPDSKVFPEISALEDWKGRYDSIVSWLPTHRLFSGHTLMDLMTGFGFDQAELDAVLDRHNTLLVIKAHFLDYQGARGRFDNHPNIKVYAEADPYPLLRYSDALITDYSSVYLDFLNADRPILFAPFDFDQYIREEVPFYYDYDAVTTRGKGPYLARVGESAGSNTGSPENRRNGSVCRESGNHEPTVQWLFRR